MTNAEMVKKLRETHGDLYEMYGVMQDAAGRITSLGRDLCKAKIEMADILRDLFTVCDNPDATIRARKAEKWREWMMKERGGRE